MNDLYYMQFSNAVLETMKTAKEALTEEEYKLFIESVQRLCEQGILDDETEIVNAETDKLKNMCRVLFNRCRATGSFNGQMCVFCGMKKECEEMHSI